MMLDHSVSCLFLGELWHRIDLWIYFTCNILVRSVVDQLSLIDSLSSVREETSAHLGRQIMGMRVKVTLSASIHLSRLHGIEPFTNGWVLFSQIISLVIEQRSVHSFDVWCKDDVSCSKVREEVWTWSAQKTFFN
jgi:hypothetical protein